jgi:glyoxylase-like metal-dependent hydrolase (beta-lactamase superfamily II)
MTDLFLNRELEFEYGEVAELSPLIRRVVARNPSAFTLYGTGTYIVGRGSVAVIDPGPDDEAHVAALLAALEGETVSHIVVTHTHRDHSPAAAALKAATGAQTYGFGPHGSGRPDAEGQGEDVEEGGDMAFDPDQRIDDGDAVSGPGWTLQAVYTPGHTSNHLCFALPEEAVLFPGDHVMGWSTTIVSPPDGDMRRYMESLEKLRDRAQDRRYWPTHGPAIDAPQDHAAALIHHREGREHQIIACLADGVGTIPEMVARMYTEVPQHLHSAAERSVLAHLIHMVESGRAATDGAARSTSVYRQPN